jgi:hypothetical protein
LAAALILFFSTLGAVSAALSVWLFDSGIGVAALLYAAIGLGIPAAIVIIRHSVRIAARRSVIRFGRDKDHNASRNQYR